MPYDAAPDRYDSMRYRRCGHSGIQLPEISLGLWNNFGDDRALDTQRAILRRAFDLGVTHFDLANNYGRAHERGGANPARDGYAAAHKPAVLLARQPLDRGRPTRRARGRADRLHRVLAARAGPAHRQVPGRRTGGLARGEGH